MVVSDRSCQTKLCELFITVQDYISVKNLPIHSPALPHPGQSALLPPYGHVVYLHALVFYVRPLYTRCVRPPPGLGDLPGASGGHGCGDAGVWLQGSGVLEGWYCEKYNSHRLTRRKQPQTVWLKVRPEPSEGGPLARDIY